MIVEYAVISRRFFTGTISSLPESARLAWLLILFEAERMQGRVKLPAWDLAKAASITPEKAREALRLFQEPDPDSSTPDHEGRRLIPVPGEPDWYDVVTHDKHAEERAKFFTRLRQQRWKEKQGEEGKKRVTVGNGGRRWVTNEPELELEVKEESKSKSKSNTLSLTATRKRAEELVEAFTLEQKHLEWGTKHTPSVPLETEVDAWKDRMRGNGYLAGKNPVRDPQAAFYTSCRNAEAWGTYKRPGLFASAPLRSTVGKADKDA